MTEQARAGGDCGSGTAAAATLALDDSNDASLLLDGLRFCAALMVCCGHAINLSGCAWTSIPIIGVMIFFVLSGFLIAHTLHVKSARPDYTLGDFLIERVARIYSAYLPAFLLIAATDLAMAWAGHPIATEPTGLRAFLGNLVMLQGYPGPLRLGVSTFGSGGHLTTVAAEFHIYLFVGALFFAVIARGRARAMAIACAFLASAMPLGYFLFVPGEASDRSLFVLWLMGFAAHAVASAFAVDRGTSLLGVGGGLALGVYWWLKRPVGNEYNIGCYPLFVLSFLLLVVGGRSLHFLSSSPRLAAAIRFLASWSFSLFLVHFSVEKVIFALCGRTLSAALAGIGLSCVLAMVFAQFTELRHKSLAVFLKRRLLPGHRLRPYRDAHDR
ncbi:MAG: acyltransferase [Planctomycetes bacterium]|nr:acyltransferase [Planctomycetota bacterium]